MLCQHCQILILDSLYGLLDEPEASAVETHLRECAACASARAEAVRVQGLLTRAARDVFPQVRFEAPATTTPSRTIGTGSLDVPVPAPAANAPIPASSTPPGRSARIGLWLAWTIAAGVLIAVPGTVVPVLNVLNRAELAHKASNESKARAQVASSQTQQTVAEVESRWTKVNYDLVVARQAQESLFARWVADEKALVQSPPKTSVEVQKAATVQPGAPNDVWLVLHDHGLTPHSRLLAEVRDQTDAVVYSQQLNPEKRDNRHILHLPAEVWTRLTPQSELFLAIAAVDDKTGTKTEIQEKVRLFGPVYATLLTTDRATYHPGDTLYFRSLTLDRITFLPPPREQVLAYELQGPTGHPARRPLLETGGTELVRIHEGKVDLVLGPDGKPIHGVGCGAFTLPNDLPSGDYQLVLHELEHPAGLSTVIPNYTRVVRPIKVQSGVPDVYAKMIHFGAASYSAGDTVEAWAELKFQGQPAAGVEVKAIATADNLQLNEIAVAPTNKDGRSRLRFTLPRTLDQGDVRIKVTFRTKAGEETVAERVPVIGRRVHVEFFPEGGTQVAGVPCRMYIRATTPTGQPVDIKGSITDGHEVLARVETLTDRDQPGVNRGIGSFIYTPTLHAPVWLKLESPGSAFAPLLEGAAVPIAPAVAAGAPAALSLRFRFMLPQPIADGVVMSVANPVTAPGEPFRVLLQSAGRPRKLVVGAYTRGRLSDTKRIDTQPGKLAAVELMAGPDPRGGVVRITVFEEPAESLAGATKSDLKPLAERLVFRNPGKALQLSFAINGLKNADGTCNANTPVDLAITARDEKGKPAAAILWAAVVNSGVAPGKRDRLPATHFLLAGEITTPDAMEYADFLLTDQPHAAECLDLVLATQGWRHFVEQTPASPNLVFNRAALDPERARLLSTSGQFMQPEHPGARDRRKLYEKYRPRYEAATTAVEAAKAASDAAAADTSAEARVREAATSARHAHDEAAVAAEQARTAAEPVERIRGSAWYGVAGFGLLALMLGTMALVRPLSRLPYGIGTAGSVGLVAFLVVALGMAERTEAAIRGIEVAAAPEVRLTRPAPVQLAAGPDVRKDSAAGIPSASPKFAGPMQSGVKKNDTDGGNAGRMQPMTVPGFGGGGMGGAPKPGGSVPPAPLAPSAPGKGAADAVPSPSGIPPGSAVPSPSGIPPGSAVPSPPGIPPGSAVPPAPKILPAPGMGGRNDRDGKSDWAYRGEGRRAIPDWELTPSSDPHTPFALRRLESSKAELERQNLAREQLTEFAAKRTAAAPNLDRVLPQVQAADTQKKGKVMVVKAPDVSPDVMAYNRVRAALVATTPLVVREYAAPRPGSGDTEREPADTILWQPVIVLPSDGNTTLHFQLGSARGGYQVIVAGHTLDGRIGAVRGFIPVASSSDPTLPPVTVPPKVP